VQLLTRLKISYFQIVTNPLDYVEKVFLPNIKEILETNSVTLSKLAESIESEIKENVIVARKYTSDRMYLAGITIDYRYLKDWLEPSLNEIIQRYSSSSSIPGSDLYIQTYRSNPFLDVYSGYCDKGMAFDLIVAQILNLKKMEK
jgi:hypothetical protein